MLCRQQRLRSGAIAGAFWRKAQNSSQSCVFWSTNPLCFDLGHMSKDLQSSSLMSSILAPCSHYFPFVSLCVHLLVVDSWVGYEHSSFCGQQFVLERGEYPHWESWSGSNAYHIERMMSFRPICSAVRFCFPLSFLHFSYPEEALWGNCYGSCCSCNNWNDIIWIVLLFGQPWTRKLFMIVNIWNKNKINTVLLAADMLDNGT